LVQKLLPLLARMDVSELLLQSGQPPIAVLNGAQKRLSATLLRDEDIIGVLAAVGGGAHLARMADGVDWDCTVNGVGIVHVRVDHDGLFFTASLRRAESPARVEAPAAAPARKGSAASRWTASAPEQFAATLAGPAAPRPAAHPRGESFATAETGPVAQPAPVEQAPAPVLDEDGQPVRIITSHDGFNFQTSGTGWSAPPPPMQAVRARAPEPLAKFAGDAIDMLLHQARTRQASDAHILSDRPATLRIAGELVPIAQPLTDDVVRELLLKRIPDNLRAAFEAQGSCDFALAHPQLGRFRVNITRQRSGMKLTARPIGKDVPTLEELGLPDSIGRALHHHQGLIVIVGPTGSGKTTTLAALVGMINRDTTHHVITVEDPIEYVHETAKAIVSQREVGTHTKTFQAALKGSLREDPDVIVVGELRDTETVRMALSASETGHLVIATMNTPSAAKAIERLIDLFPPGDQPQVRMTLAGGLRLIIAQRLLPTADRESMCAAAEILPGVPQLWALIRDDKTFQIPSLQQRGKAMGIVRLDESLASLVKAGRTTLEIAKEYAESPDLLDSMVTGKPMPNAPPPDPSAKPSKAPKAPSNKTIPGAPAAMATAAQVASKEVGKQLLSRAGKLFGRDEK
jgi:twitching motility protein PilT